MKYILYKATAIPRKIRELFFVWINPVLLRLAGVKLGKRSTIRNRVYIAIERNATVDIGEDFNCYSGEGWNPLSRNLRSEIYVKTGAHLQIGHHSGMSSACIWVNKSVSIGNYVKIGANTVIVDNDCHSLNCQFRRNSVFDAENINSASIIIEDDVLIGANCIILKGVTIGARSIVGAGSVVTKSIPSDCVACGNPAKVINQ